MVVEGYSLDPKDDLDTSREDSSHTEGPKLDDQLMRSKEDSPFESWLKQDISLLDELNNQYGDYNKKIYESVEDSDREGSESYPDTSRRNNHPFNKNTLKPKNYLDMLEKDDSFFRTNTKPRSYINILRERVVEDSGQDRTRAKPQKASLNLSATVISSFPHDELIIYLNDKLYFLSSLPVSQKNPSEINIRGVVNLDGKIYPFGSSLDNNSIIHIAGSNHLLKGYESFLGLEKRFLSRNKKEIDSFKADYIKRLARENSILKEKYSSLERLLKNDDSLDALVRNYFYPITKGIDIEKIISENKKGEAFNKEADITKIREIQFDHNHSFFYSLISDKNIPLLITGGECYCITPELKFLERTDTMESKYKKFISENIKKKIRNSVNSYFEDLAVKDKKLMDLNDKIDSATSRPPKDFGADRISEDEYVLYKNTGEYGVEWNGQFYLFSPVKIGISLIKSSNGYKIDESAFVYKDPYYKHPYIQGIKGQERRVICSAGRLDLICSQIGLDSTPSKDKAHLMKSAKYLLNRFENIIKRGHNSDHHPFDSLYDSAKTISPAEVEYYKRRGVEFFRKIY